MWALMVILVSPLFREHVDVPESIEDLPIEEFVPELAVDALHIPVSPRAARRDEEGHGSHPVEP